jgi:HSP20 family protein
MTRITLPSLFADPDRVAAFRGMRREFDDLLGRFGIADALSPMPAIDVVRDEAAITVTADLPGVPAEDVDVTVTGDALRIAGKVDEAVEHTEGEFVYSERRRGAFSRTIPLGFEPEADAIDTKLSGGVLTIKIAAPAQSAPQSRKIEVKTG